MYLIPFIRTSRAIIACTLLPDNPLVAITTSEIISYTVPFINNSPIHAPNNMILFLFYYFYYTESGIELMNDFKKKYMMQYKLESISILIYLFFYFINKIN